MICLTIFFAILLVGMECRSMSSSNLNRAVEGYESHESARRNLSPDLENLEDDLVNLTNVSREYLDKLAKEFVAKSANVTSDEENADDWLNKLESSLNSLTNDTRIEKSNGTNEVREIETTLHEGNRSFVLISGDNWLEDLQDFLDEQYGESNEDSENYVRSRAKDSSTSYSLDQRDAETTDDLVADFQNDVSGPRRYFGKLCRKHRTAS